LGTLPRVEQLERAGRQVARVGVRLLADAGEEPYANPRNLTAGTLKLLDPRQSAQRRLRLFAYSLGTHEGVEVTSHRAALDLLKRYGFPVNPHAEVCPDIECVIACCQT